MPLDSLVVFLCCAFGAEVIGTMAGFGAATVLTPIAGLFFDIKTAMAIVACFHLFGNASRLVFFGRRINWRIAWAFGSTAVVGSFAGAALAAWLPSPAVRLLLGAFLILYSMSEVLRLTAVRVPSSTSALVVGGIASGTISGLIGTGGAIRSVCLLTYGLPKEAYLGTSAVIALVVDATRIPVYLAEGFLPASLSPIVLGLIAIAFCGSWAGQRLVRIVSPVWFKRFVLGMLLLMGLKLALDGWRGMP